MSEDRRHFAEFIETARHALLARTSPLGKATWISMQSTVSGTLVMAAEISPRSPNGGTSVEDEELCPGADEQASAVMEAKDASEARRARACMG